MRLLERFPHPYKECFVFFSNRHGISRGDNIGSRDKEVEWQNMINLYIDYSKDSQMEPLSYKMRTKRIYICGFKTHISLEGKKIRGRGGKRFAICIITLNECA